jgi:hypothetical protein
MLIIIKKKMNTNKKVTPGSKFLLLQEREKKWMYQNNTEWMDGFIKDRQEQLHKLFKIDREEKIHKLLGNFKCLTKEDRINLFKKIDYEEFPGAMVYKPSGYMNVSRVEKLDLKYEDFGSLYPSIYKSINGIDPDSTKRKIDRRCKIINKYLSNKPEKSNIREEIIIHDPRYNTLEIYTNPRAITNIVIIMYQMKIPLMFDVYRYIIDALGIPNNREINLIIDKVLERIYQVKLIK